MCGARRGSSRPRRERAWSDARERALPERIPTIPPTAPPPRQDRPSGARRGRKPACCEHVRRRWRRGGFVRDAFTGAADRSRRPRPRCLPPPRRLRVRTRPLLGPTAPCFPASPRRDHDRSASSRARPRSAITARCPARLAADASRSDRRSTADASRRVTTRAGVVERHPPEVHQCPPALLAVVRNARPSTPCCSPPPAAPRAHPPTEPLNVLRAPNRADRRRSRRGTSSPSRCSAGQHAGRRELFISRSARPWDRMTLNGRGRDGAASSAR